VTERTSRRRISGDKALVDWIGFQPNTKLAGVMFVAGVEGKRGCYLSLAVLLELKWTARSTGCVANVVSTIFPFITEFALLTNSSASAMQSCSSIERSSSASCMIPNAC